MLLARGTRQSTQTQRVRCELRAGARRGGPVAVRFGQPQRAISPSRSAPGTDRQEARAGHGHVALVDKRLTPRRAPRSSHPRPAPPSPRAPHPTRTFAIGHVWPLRPCPPPPRRPMIGACSTSYCDSAQAGRVRSAQVHYSRRNVARRSTQPGGEPAVPAFIKTTAYNGPSNLHSERQEALVGVTGSGTGNGAQAASGAAPGVGQTQPLTRQDYGKFVQFFRQASPYIEGHRARLFVIVIPGEVGGWRAIGGRSAGCCWGPAPLTPRGRPARWPRSCAARCRAPGRCQGPAVRPAARCGRWRPGGRLARRGTGGGGSSRAGAATVPPAHPMPPVARHSAAPPSTLHLPPRRRRWCRMWRCCSPSWQTSGCCMVRRCCARRPCCRAAACCHAASAGCSRGGRSGSARRGGLDRRSSRGQGAGAPTLRCSRR
jgi:hypothetical protein